MCSSLLLFGSLTPSYQVSSPSQDSILGHAVQNFALSACQGLELSYFELATIVESLHVLPVAFLPDCIGSCLWCCADDSLCHMYNPADLKLHFGS